MPTSFLIFSAVDEFGPPDCFQEWLRKRHIGFPTGVCKNSVRNRVRIDDVVSILKFHIGFPFRENSVWLCKSVWVLESILNFRIGSISSIGGLIAATLFAAPVSVP